MASAGFRPRPPHLQRLSRRTRALTIGAKRVLLRHYRDILEKSGLGVVPLEHYVRGMDCQEGEYFGLVLVKSGKAGFKNCFIVERAEKAPKTGHAAKRNEPSA